MLSVNWDKFLANNYQHFFNLLPRLVNHFYVVMFFHQLASHNVVLNAEVDPVVWLFYLRTHSLSP
jgi:hypothetical protein